MTIMTSVSIKNLKRQGQIPTQGQCPLEFAYYCFSHWSMFKKLNKFDISES